MTADRLTSTSHSSNQSVIAALEMQLVAAVGLKLAA